MSGNVLQLIAGAGKPAYRQAGKPKLSIQNQPEQKPF